jgi:hypothetical protein
MDDRQPFERQPVRRRAWRAAAGALLVLALAVPGVAAGGPPGVAFYVDGDLYRTIGTPTDLSGTGAPSRSYDIIYALGGDLMNVAEAAPGDSDYNGGRWMVLPVTWESGVTPFQLESAEEVLAAEDAGLLTIAASPAKQFVCPVIPVGGHG